VDEHDKDIRSYGPCVRLYHWHGGGDGHCAHRLGSYGLSHRKLLIQARGRHNKVFTILPGKFVVMAEKFDGNREARQALALSVAGVVTIMLVWNLIMLFLY
jgi:hypothetical protein